MPVIHIDTEQAALIETALVMLESALTARVTRADPEKIISNSLKLQAAKLATVRTLLAQEEPPDFSALPTELQMQVYRAAFEGLGHRDPQIVNAAWRQIRGVAIAAAFPRAT